MRASVTVIRKNETTEKWSLPPILARILPWELQAVLRAVKCRRVEEIHLRVGSLCSVTDEKGRNLPLDIAWSRAMMDDLVRALCDGSRYTLSHCIDRGYICPGGGVRVGLCGLAGSRMGEGEEMCVKRIDTVCIRLPGHFSAVGQGIVERVRGCLPRGVLFFSPPGVGKTTLIRALATMLSSGDSPLRTVLVDTRRELDDGSFTACRCLDILSGYPKGEGIEIAVRSLGAQVILCDELGAAETRAVLSATLYGVPLIATAHALHVRQLLCRPEIKLLRSAGTFAAYIGLARAGMGEDYLYTVTEETGAEGM
ncbi:MAG: AAA family ATPase [Clostridia bacterium]|nr:AAA family ATPase [Clostridia bacterium]